jgi:chloride channel protein, CIC family
MMRQDVRTVPAHTRCRVSALFPLGSASQVVAVNEDKSYAGSCRSRNPTLRGLDQSSPVRAILRYPDTTLLPTMTTKEAVTLFDKAEAEALAFVQSFDRRRVVGLLSETHALRRYAEELEQRRQD